ncbi:hypothetical protein [Vibrio parahaemolyticus]|uniref:hypothetical protein n=1 Tax=Vibrio parahaemolyticus TaxID=670 RepID=UPI00041E0977|nr:hypothetical protein [Vibrio parahaemolyticus]
MKTVRDWVLLVDKLTELTQYNEITWVRESAPDYLQSTISRVDFVYFVYFNNQQFRLYEEMYKYFTDEDEFYWETQVRLDLVDNLGNVMFDVPKTRNMYNLIQAVKYQTSDINRLFSGW